MKVSGDTCVCTLIVLTFCLTEANTREKEQINYKRSCWITCCSSGQTRCFLWSRRVKKEKQGILDHQGSAAEFECWVSASIALTCRCASGSGRSRKENKAWTEKQTATVTVLLCHGHMLLSSENRLFRKKWLQGNMRFVMETRSHKENLS